MITPTQAVEAPKTFTQKMLDGVERVGNKVPHPAVIFVSLAGLVIVLSHILYLAGARVAYEVINPETHKIEKMVTEARSLLTVDGIRFMFTGFVHNFMSFEAVGVIIVAMVGVGVAEESGLVNALIRKLVIVSPPWSLTIASCSSGSCRASPPTPATSS
jgi:aminobenzoyl-glutamate transport protein